MTGTSKHGMTRGEYRSRAREFVARGEMHYAARLSAQQVRAILAKFRPYCPVNGRKAMAKQYGVHERTIYRITSRESWANITAGHIRDLFGEIPARPYRGGQE